MEVGAKGRDCCGRGGDTSEETSSALPSRDSDNRTCEEGGAELSVIVILSGHDEGAKIIEL